MTFSNVSMILTGLVIIYSFPLRIYKMISSFSQQFAYFHKIFQFGLLPIAISDEHGLGSVNLDLPWRWLPSMVAFDHRRWVNFSNFANTHTASFNFPQLTIIRGVLRWYLTTFGVGLHGRGQSDHCHRFLWPKMWPIDEGGVRSRVLRVFYQVN